MKVTADIDHNHRDTYWDGNSMLQALHAAEHWLRQHVPAINQMNVFPVPDGDTGTNMHLTLSAALYGVVPVASCALLANQVYRGALMGARGNSGVILSQILRGIASGLAEHDMCGPEEFVHALEAASATAYHSTSDPREGTILTVIRETSEAVRAAFETHTHTLHSLLAVAVDAARAAVERTPTMLAVLREAGVVDAGGQGLYIIFDGMYRWVKGEPFELDHQPIPDDGTAMIPHAMLHGEDDYGYCTNLLVQGTELPFEVIRAHMEAVGTSTVVVGDRDLIRIHVHTERPGDILNYVMQFGEPIRIEITNMDQQRREIKQQTIEPLAPEPDRSTAQVGVVVVAAGSGFTTLFTNLGGDAVALVSGGQTANPSTSELLEAAEQLPQSEVIVLPNNGNVLLAAQQAASMSQKQIAVLPTKTIPQGLAAMVRYSPDVDLATCLARMQPELTRVRTVEITTAVRDAMISGLQVRQGQTIALLDGTLVAAGQSADEVIRIAMQRIQIEQYELITIYYGAHISHAQAEALAATIQAAYPAHELELRAGRQPVYDFILAAE